MQMSGSSIALQMLFQMVKMSLVPIDPIDLNSICMNVYVYSTNNIL